MAVTVHCQHGKVTTGAGNLGSDTSTSAPTHTLEVMKNGAIPQNIMIIIIHWNQSKETATH